MTRPRVSLGLEASRATLDRAVCLRIGRLLAEAREGLGLTVPDVAASLLLSTGQVRALEAVQPEAFYGADFYVNALKKYAALVNLESDLLGRALVGPARGLDVSPPPFRRGRTVPGVVVRKAPKSWKPLIMTTALVGTGVMGWLLVSALTTQEPVPPQEPSFSHDADLLGGQSVLASPEPRVVQPAAAPPVPLDAARPVGPLAESTESEAAVATTTTASTAPAATPEPSMPEQASEAVGHVKVSTPTWVFVRYGDNSTAERALGPGQAFVLSRLPVYLAVGVAEGADVVIGGRAIDTQRFSTNGQLRVGASELARLGVNLH